MEGKKALYLRISRFPFRKPSHPKGGYVRSSWDNVFLSCEGLAGKLLAGHLLRDYSRLEEDMPGQ